MKGDLELAIRHLKNEYHFSFESDQMKAADGAESELAALREAVNEARRIIDAVGSSSDDDRVCEIRVERDKDSAWWVSSACIAWLAAHPAEDVKK